MVTHLSDLQERPLEAQPGLEFRSPWTLSFMLGQLKAPNTPGEHHLLRGNRAESLPGIRDHLPTACPLAGTLKCPLMTTLIFSQLTLFPANPRIRPGPASAPEGPILQPAKSTLSPELPAHRALPALPDLPQATCLSHTCSHGSSFRP